MTDTAQRLLKICSTDRAPAGVLCFVLRLVISAEKADAQYLTAAADKLCRTYPGFNGRQIAVLGPDNSGLSGLPFQAVLSASYSGHKAFAFILPVTGKYGVYPAVFL